MMFSALLLLLPTVVFAASSPPSGAITVGPSSTGAKYTTLSAALANTSSNTYFIYSGTYTGQAVISRANVVIYGQTSNAQSYSSNTVTLTNALAASAAGGDDQSGTLRITSAGTGIKLYNLNIANTYGTTSNHTQAIALSVYGTNFACYACQLRGIQDTLLAEAGYQFYGKSLIQGSVDFIFGQTSSIWIYDSVINTVGSGCITASGRSSNDASWYVIDHSTIQGTGTVYLGRPWSDYARVVYQYSSLSSIIQPAGWSAWSTATPNTDHVYYGEFNNTGAGAWQTGRASFATKLTAPIAINTVLGSTSWIDSAYLSGTVATSTAAPTSTSAPATTSTTAPSAGTVPQYGQCGGIGYTGSTTCAAPFKCTYSNDYYSQCL